LTDHAADLLLAPTEEAVRHLTAEGLGHRTELVGDVMVDVCLRVRDDVLAGRHAAPKLPDGIDPEQPYLLPPPPRRGEHRRPEAAGPARGRARRAAHSGGAAGTPASRGPGRGPGAEAAAWCGTR